MKLPNKTGLSLKNFTFLIRNNAKRPEVSLLHLRLHLIMVFAFYLTCRELALNSNHLSGFFSQSTIIRAMVLKSLKVLTSTQWVICGMFNVRCIAAGKRLNHRSPSVPAFSLHWSRLWTILYYCRYFQRRRSIAATIVSVVQMNLRFLLENRRFDRSLRILRQIGVDVDIPLSTGLATDDLSRRKLIPTALKSY